VVSIIYIYLKHVDFTLVKIQAFWRSKTTNQRVKRVIRQYWDQQVSSLALDNLSKPQLQTLIRQLLFFYTQSEDEKRLDAMCDTLWLSIRKEQKKRGNSF
jgi:hypothetical protein